MVTERKKVTVRGGVKKLRLKKETIRDIDPKGRDKEIKGGSGSPYCDIPTRLR